MGWYDDLALIPTKYWQYNTTLGGLAIGQEPIPFADLPNRRYTLLTTKGIGCLFYVVVGTNDPEMEVTISVDGKDILFTPDAVVTFGLGGNVPATVSAPALNRYIAGVESYGPASVLQYAGFSAPLQYAHDAAAYVTSKKTNAFLFQYYTVGVDIINIDGFTAAYRSLQAGPPIPPLGVSRPFL